MRAGLIIAALAIGAVAACSEDITPQSGVNTAPVSAAPAQPATGPTEAEEAGKKEQGEKKAD